MLTVLSPAKSLDYDSRLPTRKFSLPSLQAQTRELVEIMAAKSPGEIAELMNLSSDLAELNWERFQDWEPEFTRANARPAVLAFKGGVYQSMAPEEFTERDFTYAQRHLRILSGLHGLLKPLDLVQPYRLEMSTKLANSRGKTLYDFWKGQITRTLQEELESQRPKVLVNLASQEYFSAVDAGSLDARVVSPTFLDWNRDEYRNIGFFAKRARGSMASWIIRHRVNTMKQMREFEGLGYRYSAERSTTNRPMFIRDPQQ